MTLGSKIILIISGMILLCAVGFIIYQQHEMANMQQQINTTMVAQKTLLDNITRSSAQYATKQDLDSFAQQNNVNLAAIQKDVDSLNATVSGINAVVATSNGQNQNNLPSTSVTPNPTPTPTPTVTCNGQQIPCPSDDPYGYQKNEQTFQLDEQFTNVKVPVGTTSFSAWQQNPWSVDLYPRTYDMTNVLATDPNGKQYVYNQFSISVNGKSYTVPISTAKFVQQYPSPSFSFWNPRLYLTVGGGLNVSELKGSADVGATLGIVSYGQSKVTPALSILQLGLGYEAVNKEAEVIINPVNFNMGSVMPTGIIDNTYIGPTFQIGFNGNMMLGLSLSIGL